VYVNAGQNPPLLRRALGGGYERLGATGVALGMFEGSTFESRQTRLAAQDLLVLYSDGITEAEDPSGRPFEESGLERVLDREAAATPADIGLRDPQAVEGHARDSRFADDLTIRDPETGVASAPAVSCQPFSSSHPSQSDPDLPNGV
jgi:phosphoserine phosphatase RsbU/P